MDLEKRENLIDLYDLYKGLLTTKQRNYFEAYYFDDLSFAEIALSFDVSRNAVFDQLKKVSKSLENYESILKLDYKYKKIGEALELQTKEEIKNTINQIIEE